MTQIAETSYEAIKRYFDLLGLFGYKSYAEVEKLLVMLHVEELLNGPLSSYISRQDYRTILEALTCITGSTCLIPFEDYPFGSSLTGIVPGSYVTNIS